MSESMLRRLSGMALMLSVPLWIAGEAIHPRSEGLADIVRFGQSPSHAILAIAFMFLLLGLPGLYGSHAGRSGVLGLVGYVLMVVFVAYHVYMFLYETGPVAFMARDSGAERLFAEGGVVEQGTLRTWLAAPVSLAPVIYGIALVRAGRFSRAAGWLVISWLPVFVAFNVMLAALPPTGQEILFDLRFANVGIGGSYLLLLVGLAMAGNQLRRWSLAEEPHPNLSRRRTAGPSRSQRSQT